MKGQRARQWAKASSCDGKKRYPDRAKAQISRAASGRYTCEVYHCKHCGGWHLGRNSRHRTRPVAAVQQITCLDEVR